MKQEVFDKINDLKLLIKENLSQFEQHSFKDTSSFPDKKGIYFVYNKNEIVYIGAAWRKEKALKKRCKQPISANDTGGTLRNNIECFEELDRFQAADYIKEKLTIKFYELDDKTERSIKLEEQLFIGLFKPKYNK